MFLPFCFCLLLLAKSPATTLGARVPPSQQAVLQDKITGQDHPGPGEPSATSAEKMSMFSVYVPLDPPRPQQTLLVRCKVGRALHGIERRLTVDGIVQEDVVSGAGKILIPAGSTVVGQGYCDYARNRILATGRWTFYLSDHQITIDGTLWANEQQEGLGGQEAEVGLNESRIKEPIYPGAPRLFVSEGTDFVLHLTGNISVRDLGSAFEK